MSSVLSLPTWERGLKFLKLPKTRFKFWVAPYMGAWIEILAILKGSFIALVAPYMGAWIEI